MMHIIITGPDNSGKTTLIALLRRSHPNITYGKASVVENKEALQLVHDIVYKTMAMNNNTIWDRWYYPADLIYGQIVEGYDTPLDVQDSISKLQVLDTIFVVVTASPEVLKQRYEQEEFYYANLDHILAAAKAYEDFCLNAPFPIIRIDTSNLSPQATRELFWKSLDEGGYLDENSNHRTHFLFRAN